MPHFFQSAVVYKKPEHTQQLIQKSLRPLKEIIKVFCPKNGVSLYMKTELLLYFLFFS